jgi:hypothetical protein
VFLLARVAEFVNVTVAPDITFACGSVMTPDKFVESCPCTTIPLRSNTMVAKTEVLRRMPLPNISPPFLA